MLEFVYNKVNFIFFKIFINNYWICMMRKYVLLWVGGINFVFYY